MPTFLVTTETGEHVYSATAPELRIAEYLDPGRYVLTVIENYYRKNQYIKSCDIIDVTEVVFPESISQSIDTIYYPVFVTIDIPGGFKADVKICNSQEMFSLIAINKKASIHYSNGSTVEYEYIPARKVKVMSVAKHLFGNQY